MITETSATGRSRSLSQRPLACIADLLDRSLPCPVPAAALFRRVGNLENQDVLFLVKQNILVLRDHESDPMNSRVQQIRRNMTDKLEQAHRKRLAQPWSCLHGRRFEDED